MSYPRSVARILLVAAVAAAVVFAANALLRPGCSLFPVALPDDPSGRQSATLEQVCAALGRPLPQATILPDGVERSALLFVSAPPSNAPRFVTVSYAKTGRGVALLNIIRGGIASGNVGEINGTVAGVPAIITQSRPSATDFDDVAYLWARDGLLFTLHVGLAPGITREAADAMAASIR